jgi:putative ABC transport system permease protein
VFQSLAIGLAGIALLVGAIGIVNTMVIAVLERRREIGLRRALGARAGQVLVQFLVEAIILAAAGGIVGAVLGMAAGTLYAQVVDVPLRIDPTSVAGGMVLAIVVGTLAGVYPATRASRMSPTEALRAV